MASERTKSFYGIILQLAVGIMLTVGGIWTLQGGNDFASSAVKDFFNPNISGIIAIAFGIIEIIAGIFLIIKLFAGDRFGVFGRILMIIILVAWILAVVVTDILGARSSFSTISSTLNWLYDFSKDLIILGAILACA